MGPQSLSLPGRGNVASTLLGVLQAREEGGRDFDREQQVAGAESGSDTQIPFPKGSVWRQGTELKRETEGDPGNKELFLLAALPSPLFLWPVRPRFSVICDWEDSFLAPLGRAAFEASLSEIITASSPFLVLGRQNSWVRASLRVPGSLEEGSAKLSGKKAVERKERGRGEERI